MFAFAKNGACQRASEDAVRGHRSARDAGNGLRTFDDIAEELLPVIGVIAKSTKVEQQLKQVLRLEARIVLLGILHAAKKQSRADQRHQRQ